MIRIICTKCKNAYLQKEGNSLVCPSCKAEFSEEKENLIAGIQYYNEKEYSKASDCLMKHIVQNGADPEAIFYKALCDGFDIDEDTNSLKSIYLKIAEAFEDLENYCIPHYLALANDEMAKLEKAVVENHIRLFEDADAEKIKKEVTTIINIQNDAKTFRSALNLIADKYNEQSTTNQISVNFSRCFLVDPQVATEVGDLKFGKIIENIATHTVFTGILSTDIKNLEIYYRCIVMFFERNRQKYDFLMASAEKFTELENLLAEGQYNTIKGTATIGDKLKSAAYDFFQESLKDHDDDYETNEESVKIIEANAEVYTEAEEVMEDISSVSTENSQEVSEEAPQNDEYEDISSDSGEDASINAVESSEDVSEKQNEEADNTPEQAEHSEESADTESEESADTESEESADTESEENITQDATIETEEATEEVVNERSAKEEIQEVINNTKAAKIAAEATEEISIPREVSVEAPKSPMEGFKSMAEDIAEEEPQQKKPRRKKSFAPIITGIVIVLGVLALVGFAIVPDIINENKYDKAVALADARDFGKAADAFAELGDYEDSETRSLDCKYAFAQSLEEKKDFETAKDVYISLDDYKDSKAKVDSCTYNYALSKLDAKEYDKALAIFESISDYADSEIRIQECKFQKATSLIDAKQYTDAIDILSSIEKYPGAKEKTLEAKYAYVKENLKKDDAKTVEYLNDLSKAGYKDSTDIRNSLLGTKSKKVASCINYSKTDTKRNLKIADNSKAIYFHVVVNDAKFYNKKLTIQYTTSMGYTEKKSIVLTKGKKTYAMYYPSTRVKNYTVKFKLIGNDKSTLASQTVTIK